jgi:hypothetical protein
VDEVPTELPSAVIVMGARSYVPRLGRFLQTDPVSGGSANAYAYTFGDPVNTSDPSGALTYGFFGWLQEANNQEAQAVAAREVTRETLEREEAERRAHEPKEAEERAYAAAATAEPLGGYGGWACEYAGETGQEAAGCGGGGFGFITYAAPTGGPSNKVNHGGSANEGGTGPCRSGAKKVNGQCQPQKGGGSGSGPQRAVLRCVIGAGGGAEGGPPGAALGCALGAIPF